MGVYNYDHTLQALPVPELADTCTLLKELAKPLVDETAWEKMCCALDAFEQSSGQKLQKKLLQWKSERGKNASWLRPIWDDNYLTYCDRLPVNMNYCFQLPEDRWGTNALPLLLSGLCHVLNQLRLELLPPEEFRGNYLSMEALTHMIYTRIPDLKRDILHCPSLAMPFTSAVVCKGHWFVLSLTDEQDNILDPESIQAALHQIRLQAEKLPPAAGVGALTCAPRKEAHEIRNLLQKDPLNRTSLESLENTVCVVCLDDSLDNSFISQLIVGNPRNRWFDKSIQFIQAEQQIGINLEHSGCDASIWIYFLSQLDAYLLNHPPLGKVSGKTAHTRLLQWNITDETSQYLHHVNQNYSDFSSCISFFEKKLTSISRKKIKAINCRPDAVVQALYQTAYYKLTGHFRSTYEAVSTRAYYQGRTECIRPCTSAVTDFAKSFVEHSVDSATLLQKFEQAESAHMNQISRGQKALGAERHMSGLLAMHAMDPEHSADIATATLLKTKGYQTLKYDALSTSSTVAPFIEYFGFGPVVEDGIGIGYGLQADALHIAVSSYPKSQIDPAAFLDTLDELAQEFFELFAI